MNLYKLTLILEQYKGNELDAMHGIIVAAENPKEARKIANKEGKDEVNCDPDSGCYRWGNNNIWLKAKYTKVQKIGVAAK